MGESDGGGLGDILRNQGKVSDEQLEEARQVEGDTAEELIRMGVVSTDDIAEGLAEQFGMEIVHDLMGELLPEVQGRVPYSFVKKQLALPVRMEGDAVVVAVHDPLNLDAVDELRMLLGRPVIAAYAPKDTIVAAMHVRYDRKSGEASEMIAGMEGGEDFEGEVAVYDLMDEAKGQPPVIRLLNLIFTEAIQQGASDIHFDPGEADMHVRYRIDGVLQDRHAPAREYQAQLLTRVKVMAELDIAERRLPQDGRIKVKMGARQVDFRVSTLPVQGGERIVLRILDKGNVVLGLDRLGIPKAAHDQFRELIRSPEGIVLVTGPTGSGKTTTLYSALHDIFTSEINIMTVEDPVEYNLPGIAQIAVRSKIGLTFATGLRSILRQDPDVVMIGEIRDAETAEIAIQASLTGHLVLSTLHTNDAPSAVTRLVDMGIEPYLLSSSVIGVVAQRLVRKVCTACQETYVPTDKQLKDLGLERSDLKGKPFNRGTGCSACFGSGYKGRHGLYELMIVTDPIRHQVVESADASQLRKLALSEGMMTLRNHGAQLVMQGITTEAEVLRVTRGVN